MKLMDKMNCGIIYAVKLNKENDRHKSIASFLSKYTDAPVEYYSNKMLENALARAIADLLNHMDYPSSFWHEYWHLKQDPWNMNDFDAMCAALAIVQVRNDKEYMNGFSPIEENEF